MVLTSLTKYREFGLLLLRVGLGVIMVMHGWPLLMDGPAKWIALGSAMKYLHVDLFFKAFGLAAVLSEVLGGVFLILGLLFRPACLLLCFTMVVATSLHVHKHDDFGTFTSHALVLGIVFFSLLLIGPGKYSLDKS